MQAVWPQDELQGEGEASRSREAQYRARKDLQVRQEGQKEIERLRNENILLRARIVQMKKRLAVLEKAIGGLKPYKILTTKPDEKFKSAIKKLRRKDST